ncbi:MAG: hypothetical protein Q8Q42_03595 [Nanoarchaeota archaeon]|nr:hypothetical protein [Nanoarchaeota archaeon]
MGKIKMDYNREMIEWNQRFMHYETYLTSLKERLVTDIMSRPLSSPELPRTLGFLENGLKKFISDRNNYRIFAITHAVPLEDVEASASGALKKCDDLFREIDGHLIIIEKALER